MIWNRILALPLVIGLLLPLPGRASNDPLGQAIAPELKISYSLSDWNVPTGAIARHQDLWERIREGFGLAEVNPALTQQHEQWFKARADYLQRAIERSRLYLFHIVEEVEKRGMPMEIALLPLIESAYNPMALSPRQASGIWQFIPSTGRNFGLLQNAWYDGRRDVLAATRAALDYLELLHRQFGSWELALAAYNCGEGCVARALSYNRSTGRSTAYADLRLPTETRHYVPKLLAVRNIVRDPYSAGIALDSLPNEPYFMKVSITRPMAARQAARLADMSLEEFLALNPAFQRRVIHTDTPGVLLLPADKVEAFQMNLQQKGDKHALQVYQGRKGELLEHIAAKFGVSLAWLKEHNPVKLYRGKLVTGQPLYVPATAKAAQPERLTQEEDKLRSHIVRKGETLKDVARRYKVKISDLRLYNPSTGPLRPGVKLNIPPANG